MATFIFRLSSQGVILEDMGKGLIISQYNFAKDKGKCLNLLTNYLHYNFLESLEDLDATPLDLVSVFRKVYVHDGYLPLSVVGALISVKFFLSLAQSYPGIPPVVSLDRASLE